MTTLLLLLSLLQPDLLREARQAMARKDYGTARQKIEQELRSSPSNAAARFLSGFLYYLENEIPRALPELERAAALDPKNPRPQLYRALCHESLAQNEEAARFYEIACRLEDESKTPQAETHLAYARFLFMMDRLDACEKQLARAMELEPDSRDAYYERARLLLRRNRPAEAVKAAERALELRPGGIPEEQIRYVLARARRAAE